MSDYPQYHSEYTGKYIDDTITEARKMLENESDRVSAEDLRNNAEARRNEAEAARVAAEAERVAAEGNRTTAESSRVTAEAAREAAEQARADGATGIEAGRKAAAQSAFIARLWAEGMPGAPIIVLDELEETTVSAGALSGVVSTLLNSGYYLYDGLDYAITVNGETSIVMAENQTLKAKGFEVRADNGQLILDNSAGTEPVTISINRVSALPELPDTSAREEADRARLWAVGPQYTPPNTTDTCEETTVAAGDILYLYNPDGDGETQYWIHDGYDYAVTVNGETETVTALGQSLEAMGVTFEIVDSFFGNISSSSLEIYNSNAEDVTVSFARVSGPEAVPVTSARAEALRAAKFATEAAERKKEMERYVDDALDGITEERLLTIESQIADILYEPITISSFGHDAGTRELGEVVEAVTLTWATSKAPAALELDGEAIDAALISKQLEGLNLTETTSWKLVATDERGATAEKTATLSFLNGVYYGAGAAPEGVDTSFLTKTLTGSRKRTFAANAGDGEYIWYALPVRLGACTFRVGGFEGGFDLYATVDYTNGYGYTEPYYIYRSGQTGLGSTTVEVS